MRASVGLGAAALGPCALAVALAPASAWAIPPPLLVSVGSSLGVPVAALLLALLLVLARRLGLWAVGLARVATILGAGGLALGAAWLLLAPRSAWLPCDLWDVEDDVRYSISANRIGPAGPARMPLFDLRRRVDFRRAHVPGAVHLGVPPSESSAPAELRALARELIQARVAAVARQEGAEEVSLSCYQGCTAQTLVSTVRGAGLRAWAVHEGWAALRRFQPTEAGSWDELPPLRTVDPITAQRWAQAGDATLQRLDAAALRRWMVRDPAAVVPELDRAGTAPVLLQPPDGRLVSILAARLLDAPPAAAVIWVDPARDAPWGPLAAIHALGNRLERAVGPTLWWILALLAGLLPALVGWRGLERSLAREPTGRAGAAAGAAVVVGVALLAGGSILHFGRPSIATSAVPAVLAGLGAALAAGWERDARLDWLVRPLRLAHHSLPPRPQPRLVPLLLGLATAGLSAQLSLPVALAAASALLVPLAVELGRAALWRRPNKRPPLDRLATLLGGLPAGLPSGATAHSRHPTRPGCAALVDRDGTRAVGLLDASPPAPIATALRLARASGVDVVLTADGIEQAPAPSSPAERLHHQLLALSPDLARRTGPVLDDARLAESARSPSPLAADLLVRRSGPAGGALRAARLLGMPQAPTVVHHIGNRLYDVVGERELPRGGVVRWTAPAAVELTVRLALGWHLRSTLNRMSMARNNGARGIVAALRDRPGTGAWVPELVALLGALLGEGRDHGDPAPGLAHALDPEGPRECPVPAPPALPAAVPDRLATLRGWLRHLAAAETAALGSALDAQGAALGWGPLLFFLKLDELEAVLLGDAPTRLRLRRRAEQRAEDARVLAPVSDQLPPQLCAADIAALDLAAPPSANRGRRVAGTGPAEGTVAHDHPEPGQIVVTRLPSPQQLLAWHHAGAAAVVSEQGGLLSHVAVLARELDLLFVVGVTGARRTLPPGTVLRVGADGQVTALVAPPQPGDPGGAEDDSPPGQAPSGDALPEPATVLSLDQATPDCGGKATGLARLLGAGLAVPPGVALSVTALEGALPALARAALQHPALRGASELIVRSSAIGEDSQATSFAGVLPSQRCRPEAGALAAALIRCQAAAESAPTLDYLRARAIPAPLRLGLVVQQHRSAALGGVLFTRAPGGGGPWVEASAGGAEGAVQGRAPTHAGGLDDAGLPGPVEQSLRALCPEIEALLGGPADVEWLWDGRLWVVQARPITAGLSR